VLCLLPLIAYLLFFNLGPIIQIFYLSLKHTRSAFLTLSHYRILITQPDFQIAVFNTVIIAVGSLIIELGLGLMMALILFMPLKGKNVIRTLFILPLTIPTVVVGVMMSYMFSTSGWVNKVLLDLHLIDNHIFWTAGGWSSLSMVIIADCWKVTPLVMLILLAGLNSINPDLYHAARVDGASGFVLFRHITLPLLMPHITAAVIIRGIDAFRIFSLPLILMGQNLKVIGTYAYTEYMDYQNIHLSAASSIILLLMIMSAIFIYIRLVGKKSWQAV